MPTNFAEYQREYMRLYRGSGREKGSIRQQGLTKRFVGCDGEGATLASGYHAFFMLRIGDHTLRPEGKDVRLTTRDCLDFISSLDPAHIYVGYFFDYDVTKILEDLPFPKLLRLSHRGMRMGDNGQLFPVDYQDFQVEYLPRKEFKVRKRLDQIDDVTIWSPWIVISDVGSFFQKSFLETITAWDIGTPEEREMIRVGKQQRATFEIADYEEIAEYNALEIKLLQTLMDSFRDACVKAGYVPARWQGPGLLAETMLRTHGVPRSKDVAILNDDDYSGLIRFASNAFYGGRTEVAAIGPVTQPTYQNDINAAYPHAMRYVPCLEHGGWSYEKVDATASPMDGVRFDIPTGVRGETYGLVYGSFTLGGENYKASRIDGAERGHATGRTLWYGLPMRSKQGTILFPESGKGWYWSFEIDSAVHQDFTPEEMWVYRRQCDCAPIAFVEQVYEERQRIGKNGPGVVLKLGSNSIFGKTAQSIGYPKYANPIWAGFLTAYARMMLNDFIHSSKCCTTDGCCGSDILMVATDSVATLTDRSEDYPDSEELGGWSREYHPAGIFIVQPGVYFGSSGKPSKTRGVPRTVVDAYEHVFRDAFETMVQTGEMADGDVTVPQKTFVGIKYAVHRRNLKLLGQWIEFGEEGKHGKVISFDWTSKRALTPALGPTADRGYIQTFPYTGAIGIETLPYSKDIGGLKARELARLPFDDQPDWAGVTYDDE